MRKAKRTGCSRAGLAALVGGALLLLGDGQATQAQEQEDLSIEQRVIRSLLGGLGVGTTQGSIEYRERSPLVVPPTRDLPPPDSPAATLQNPAWPKDPDLNRRVAAETSVDPDVQAQRLSLGELRRGRAAGAGRVTAANRPLNEHDASRPLRPSELGYRGGLFNSLVGTNSAEQEQFKSEPPRTALTQPPPGYQTPSPNHPYGLAPENKRSHFKLPSIWDRGTQ